MNIEVKYATIRHTANVNYMKNFFVVLEEFLGYLAMFLLLEELVRFSSNLVPPFD
jgi:hypothetical protein